MAGPGRPRPRPSGGSVELAGPGPGCKLSGCSCAGGTCRPASRPASGWSPRCPWPPSRCSRWPGPPTQRHWPAPPPRRPRSCCPGGRPRSWASSRGSPSTCRSPPPVTCWWLSRLLGLPDAGGQRRPRGRQHLRHRHPVRRHPGGARAVLARASGDMVIGPVRQEPRRPAPAGHPGHRLPARRHPGRRCSTTRSRTPCSAPGPSWSAWIAGGVLILVLERPGRIPDRGVQAEVGHNRLAAITYRQALIIGLAQCVALVARHQPVARHHPGRAPGRRGDARRGGVQLPARLRHAVGRHRLQAGQGRRDAGGPVRRRQPTHRGAVRLRRRRCSPSGGSSPTWSATTCRSSPGTASAWPAIAVALLAGGVI